MGSRLTSPSETSTPASPTSEPPTVASLRAPRLENRRDCHHVPADHVIVAAVTTSPARPTDSPRTLVNISGTNPSIAANAADVRNAAAAVAGRPGLALKVPRGTIRSSA